MGLAQMRISPTLNNASIADEGVAELAEDEGKHNDEPFQAITASTHQQTQEMVGDEGGGNNQSHHLEIEGMYHRLKRTHQTFLINIRSLDAENINRSLR